VDKNTPQTNFVDLKEVIADAEVSLAYTSSNNFVGQIIDGYQVNRALLTQEAAVALRGVQTELKPLGLGIKILDAYRPQRAVNQFVAWAKDTQDLSTKEAFYPHLTKHEIFDQGYLFVRSSHSRGSTVDLTLIKTEDGTELDMGSAFDFFDEISWSDSQDIDSLQRSNRELLRRLMTKTRFEPIATEWWHFSLANEPYPDTYFDFLIT